jgi:3-hydroxyisobutyrate dehydrogenase-like beta-hydroxyacid dehydrogenase
MTISAFGICGTGPIVAAIAARMGADGTRVIVHGFAPPSSLSRKARIEPAATLFDLASECEIVIAAYETHAALREALSGTGDRPGLLGAMVPGSLLVDLSGGLPDEPRRLAAQLAAGAIGLIEGAILGSTDAVLAGTAQVFLGGFGDHIDRITPTLSSLGPVKRIGPQGSARMYVALSESVRAAYYVALEEAQAIAAASGFVPEELSQPPLALEERAHFARQLQLALAQTHGTATPFLTALALRFAEIKPT